MADAEPLLIAHIGHWIWELIVMAPVLLLALELFVAELMDRRHPRRNAREAKERAERELDEILSS